MDFPKRKNIRLKGYDYSQPGYYFITLCTQNRKCLFCGIVGEIHESPVLRLNENGQIVREIIEQLPKRYENIRIDKYVVMPNHVHLIVIIDDNRAIRESPLRSTTISTVVGYLKMNSSKEIHHLHSHLDIWQRSFHDHIIRNEQEYKKIWEYIENNPYTWKDDCFYIAENKDCVSGVMAGDS